MRIIIFITASSKKEAVSIAGMLVKAKLVACVNIIGNVESFFWWEGKVNRGKEVMLVVKSKRSKLNKIINAVKKAHSYEVPEIIAVPIIAGEQKYLRWIDDSIK